MLHEHETQTESEKKGEGVPGFVYLGEHGKTDAANHKGVESGLIQAHPSAEESHPQSSPSHGAANGTVGSVKIEHDDQTGTEKNTP
jgi:hypothetical protein